MKRARLPILVVLLLLAAWLYLPPFAFTFIGDDFMQQWRIRMFLDAPLQVVRVLRPGWTDWYYRPLQHAWFLANRLAFGLNPFGYYLLQAWWHTLAVALLYRLARGLRLPAWAALLAAALFAFNGQHQLTVNWISSIAIIMGGVFSLLAAVL